MEPKDNIVASLIFDVKVKKEKVQITRTHPNRIEEAFPYEVFAVLIWKHEEEKRQALLHFHQGGKLLTSGEPIQRLCFERRIFDSISVETEHGPIATQDILRLSFFARTDLGAVILSLYPQMRNFAREMVFFISHKPSKVAIAQHWAASWMEMAYRHLE